MRICALTRAHTTHTHTTSCTNNVGQASVLPLYEKLGKAIPELRGLCDSLVQQMHANIRRWEGLGY